MKSILINLRSGIVVYLVALPLCLGIALACNVPLFSGILAGIIGGIIVTSMSGSVLSVSGPAAGLTAIVVTSVVALQSFEAFIAAVFFAGILQIIMGIIKAGNIAHFIPVAVIKGMLAGIGIILIMKQIPHLVGYDRDPEGDFEFMQNDGHNTFSDLYYMMRYITPGALIIGVTSIIILLFGQTHFYRKNRLLAFIPPALLAVLLGAVLFLFFKNSQFLALDPDHVVTLPVISSVIDLQNTFTRPDFSKMGTPVFWSVALTLALVASLESLLSLEAADKLDPHKRVSNTNKELIAQGMGNMACGLLGGLPVTAVIVRSSANISAGATSKSSAIIHALLLASSVFFIPNLLMLIPSASLAAILISVGYKLSTFSLFKSYYKKGLDQFLPFIVTIIVMLLTDLLKGVGAGIMIAVFFIIRNNVRSSFDIVEDVIGGKRNYLIKLPQHITFFNKGFVIQFLNKINNNSHVIIDGSINKSTDKDVKEVLLDFIEIAKEKNIEIQFVKYTL